VLSRFELMFDLEPEATAYLLEDVKNPKIGSEMKVFIPRIMQNINGGELPEEPTMEEGDVVDVDLDSILNVFGNADNCKPEIGDEQLRCQNYLIGLFDNDTAADPVLKVVRKPNKELVAVHMEVHTRVRSRFLNGKLNQLRISTRDVTEDMSRDEESDAEELAAKTPIKIRK